MFSYQYLGCSFSGVHILQTWEHTESSTGIFCNIILVTLSNDSYIQNDNDRYNKINSLIIKKIGTIPLGDRYEGIIRYRLGFLVIPKCNGQKSFREKNSLLFLL